MPEHVRTFVAIEIAADPFRDVLSDLRDMGRPVRTVGEPLHLTLAFLGDTDARLIPEISQIVRDVAAKWPPCEIELVGIGAFPRPQRPSAIWGGVSPVETLGGIAERLGSKLEEIGFPPESRSFHPHVTLARIKGRPPRELTGLFELYDGEVFGTWPVREITLYESRLKSDGPEYTQLATAELSGAG